MWENFAKICKNHLTTLEQYGIIINCWQVCAGKLYLRMDFRTKGGFWTWKEHTSPRSFRESTSTASWREWLPRTAVRFSLAVAQRAEKSSATNLTAISYVWFKEKVYCNQKQPRLQLSVQERWNNCHIRFCLLCSSASGRQEPTGHCNRQEDWQRGKKKSGEADTARGLPPFWPAS